MEADLASSRTKTYEDLIGRRAAALLRPKGAWWWKFLIPVRKNAEDQPGLQCAICDAILSAVSPDRVARGHLVISHQINTKELQQMSVEEAKVWVKKTGQKRGRRKSEYHVKKETPHQLPAKRPCVHTEATVEGTNKVGIPAQCKLQHETEPFLVSRFREECSGAASQLFNLLHQLPDMSTDVDIDTSDLSFHNQLQECASNIDVENVDLQAKNILPKSYRGRFYYDRHPEEAARDTVTEKSADAEDVQDDQVAECDPDVQDGDLDQEDSLYMDVVANCSQRYSSRSDSRIKAVPEVPTFTDEWMSNLKKIHGSMEFMAHKLKSVYDMMTYYNIHTNGKYRDGLGRIYVAITRHLEDISGQDTNIGFVGGGTFRPTLRKSAGGLSKKEHTLLDGLISKFGKHVAKQYKLLESGRPNIYPTILKVDRHPPREEQDEVPSDDIGRPPKDALPEPSSQNAEQAGCVNSISPGGLSSRANQNVLVLIKILHPALFKAKEVDVLAAGKHTLREVLKCMRCTVHHHLKNLEGVEPLAYMFLENVFYKDNSTADAEDPTENIREFCAAHNCGWPLDPDERPLSHCHDCHLDCKIEDLVLRVSNKPLGIFCHHATCEHLIHIVDVRLGHQSDPPQLEKGPVIVGRPRDRLSLCYMCKKIPASVVTYGNALSVHDPSFYCKNCFECLHYDEHGNILVDPFVVLPYGHE